jgi:hypothetical protein
MVSQRSWIDLFGALSKDLDPAPEQDDAGDDEHSRDDAGDQRDGA